ncbi:MAG: hypothetical protein D4R38_00870 [Dehalococcoidia bacterium]|nr:MAG: hypothetical protein D4R38_00870 [Dehalococcoidia bacterium]
MSFSDKSIQCSDCRNTFTFTGSEQQLDTKRAYMGSSNWPIYALLFI